MPNLPISGLPAASTLDGSELFAAVQSGVTTYTTLEDVSNYVTSSISTIDTGSLMVTGSISGQTFTFEKGDGSTFNLYLTPGGAFPINYGLFNQTGSSSPISGSTHISGSLIGGGVGSLSVPANNFVQGDAYQATFSGVLNAENNKTLQITIKTDSVVLADTGVISMPGITGDKRWRMDIDFSIREIGGTGTAEIATAGTIQFRTDSSGNVITEIFSDVNNTTFDTTIDNTLTVEAEWGSGPSDLSSIYSKLFTLLKTY
jgi:hypothetical protein